MGPELVCEAHCPLQPDIWRAGRRGRTDDVVLCHRVGADAGRRNQCRVAALKGSVVCGEEAGGRNGPAVIPLAHRRPQGRLRRGPMIRVVKLLKNGGASRDRTDGLVVANDALSQLSYSPISGTESTILS